MLLSTRLVPNFTQKLNSVSRALLQRQFISEQSLVRIPVRKQRKREGYGQRKRSKLWKRQYSSKTRVQKPPLETCSRILRVKMDLLSSSALHFWLISFKTVFCATNTSRRLTNAGRCLGVTTIGVAQWWYGDNSAPGMVGSKVVHSSGQLLD